MCMKTFIQSTKRKERVKYINKLKEVMNTNI